MAAHVDTKRYMAGHVLACLVFYWGRDSHHFQREVSPERWNKDWKEGLLGKKGSIKLQVVDNVKHYFPHVNISFVILLRR